MAIFIKDLFFAKSKAFEEMQQLEKSLQTLCLLIAYRIVDIVNATLNSLNKVETIDSSWLGWFQSHLDINKSSHLTTHTPYIYQERAFEKHWPLGGAIKLYLNNPSIIK